ncbi:MAG: type I glutamate--ammonia ligase [Chloroflexi bacterium]|nr:type I glutamate--ammonia ligase [Chloroflexota bacterium]
MPTTDKAATRQRVFEQAAAANVRFVSLQFTDIMGVVKNVHIPFHKFGDAVDDGLWFDGSSIEGFARIHESDMFLDPDLETFGVIPWERRADGSTAKVICDVYTPNGEPFAGDPRGVLRRQLKRAEEMGLRYMTGPELEFFMLRRAAADGNAAPNGLPLVEPLPHDRAGYFDLATDEASNVRKEMVEALEEFGIVVEASHHEVASGQHEIDFKYDDAMRTADNAVTFRTTLKAIAQQHGLYATFMPKPFHGVNGSGMHCHQSLWSCDGQTNLFYDAEDEYQLSATARSFMAGLLAHAPGMIAILAPLVNSYKRLVPGFEAPVYISWARINRSALIRIPQASRGRPQATRLELRCPDPSCNPYLAFSAMLAAGLDGIERDLELARPVEENLYHFDDTMIRKQGVRTLPASLGEALDQFSGDEVIQAALGAHISEWFIEAKRAEWSDYSLQVTPWELGRYLMTY